MCVGPRIQAAVGGLGRRLWCRRGYGQIVERGMDRGRRRVYLLLAFYAVTMVMVQARVQQLKHGAPAVMVVVMVVKL